jgi:hypothetical protein
MTYPLLAEPSRDTLRGLSRLRMATFVALGACGVSTIVGGFALYLFFNPGVAPGILSLPPALGLQLVVFLLQLVAVALGWSAFEEVCDSAREINSDHGSSARRAVHFMYFATATWFIGGLAGLAVFGAYFSSGLGTTPFGSLPPAAVLAVTASFALTGFAVNGLLAVAMQSLIAKLMRERGRAMCRAFYAFAVGGAAGAVAVALVCRAVLNAVDLAPLVSVVGAVSLAIYLVQIREAEEGARVLGVTRGTDPDATPPAPPERAPVVE